MSFVCDSLEDPELVSLLRDGAIGVLPTDTLYGVVCRAADAAATQRLYAVKSRESKPGTLIAASIDQLVELGFKRRYLTAYDHLWPSSLSIIIPHQIGYLSQGVGAQATRVINAPASFMKLLQTVGPLLTSSANQPGARPANTIAEAQAYFGDTVDFYVDGGDFSGREPSTIIRVVDDVIEVLRPGVVKIDEAGRIT